MGGSLTHDTRKIRVTEVGYCIYMYILHTHPCIYSYILLTDRACIYNTTMIMYIHEKEVPIVYTRRTVRY